MANDSIVRLTPAMHAQLLADMRAELEDYLARINRGDLRRRQYSQFRSLAPVDIIVIQAFGS